MPLHVQAGAAGSTLGLHSLWSFPQVLCPHHGQNMTQDDIWRGCKILSVNSNFFFSYAEPQAMSLLVLHREVGKQSLAAGGGCFPNFPSPQQHFLLLVSVWSAWMRPSTLSSSCVTPRCVLEFCGTLESDFGVGAGVAGQGMASHCRRQG